MICSFWGGSIQAWPKDFMSLGYRCCIDRFVIANSSEVLRKHQVRILFRLSKGDTIFLLSWAQVHCAISLVLCFWSRSCSVLSWRSLGASLSGARAAPGSCPALGCASHPGAAGQGSPGPQILLQDCRVQQAAHSPGDRSQPWSISPCSAEPGAAAAAPGGASSWEHFPVCPQLELSAGRAAAASSGWERWSSSKARYSTRKHNLLVYLFLHQ